MNSHGITQIIVKLLDKQMRKPRKGTEGLVYHPPILLWTGIVCGALFLIPGLLVPLATGSWETWPFLIFAAMSGACIVAYVNCRIWYNTEVFTVKYFLGYRRTFSYSEIESIQGKQRDVKLKVCRCTVRVDELAVGKKEFLDMARKQYRIAHGGKAIPVAPQPKWDLFNGHVDDPGQFLVAYLVILLLMPATVLFCFFLAKPTPMEEMTFVTASVEQLWITEDDKTDLAIFADGREMEIWGYGHTLADAEAFQKACQAGEVFTMGYRNVKNDEGEITCFCVEYIQDSSGKVWITPEIARDHRFREVILIFGIMELVWLAYCGASIYVARNANKLSKKTVRLFFKDGYVH